MKRPQQEAPINGDEIPIPIGESAFSLVERDIPDPVRLCDPWATEGVNLIASRPKLGKTTLIRQKLAAAATGGEFLDSKFEKPAKCAFLCLEEGEALCRLKFKMAGFPDEALGSIQLFFEWPRGKIGTELVDRYLTANPDVRYLVIDSLTRFRIIPDARIAPFVADYESMNMISSVSKQHPGVVIDVIHHTRKAKSDDAIDDISGTYGLTAACDSFTVLRTKGLDVQMTVGGRMWVRDASEFLIKRAPNQRWAMLGPDEGIPDEQAETLRFVKAEAAGMSGQKLSELMHITRQSAWARLDKLLEKGLVTKQFGKVYAK